LDILSCRSDVVAEEGGVPQCNLSSQRAGGTPLYFVGVLVGNYGIGPVRYRGTCHDADSLTLRYGDARELASLNLASHL
jgi:hypothetical protein